MRQFVLASLVLLAATACSTANSRRPANFPQPYVRVEPVGNLFFGSGNSAPITFEVEIGNRAQTPLRVREIEITAPGMSTYTIRPVRRLMNDEIAPGAGKTLTLFSTAITNVRDPREPLILRTIITFEAQGNVWREIQQQR